MQNVEKINAIEDEYEKFSNEQLKAKSDEFRKRLKAGMMDFFNMYIYKYMFKNIYVYV